MESMRRFIVSEEIAGTTTVLSGPEVHHMVKVLRKSKGSKVILFDGIGYEYLARIDAVGRDTVELTVLSKTRVQRESHVLITVCVSIPKGDRMEQLIRGCAELGVQRIVPLVAQRTVARGGTGGTAKLERWERVAGEASKQSGRVSLCEISPAITLENALAESGSSESLRLYGSPEATSPFVSHVLTESNGAKSIHLFIGPEGGFTREERQLLDGAGAAGVRMAETILRVETAAVALTAMVLYGTREI